MNNQNNAAAAQAAKNSDLVFFLGGADTEMCRIAEVLAEAGCEVRDAKLGWGAKASAYEKDLRDPMAWVGQDPDMPVEHARAFGMMDPEWKQNIPVLIELEIDCELPRTAIVIDHHNERAGEAPAILQVLSLLGREPTRWDYIVAANDAGWYPGLAGTAEIPGMGFLIPPASEDEMKQVRSGDYGLQGITAEMLAEVDRALSAPVEMIGSVRVVRMSHSKTGPVGDAFAIPAFSTGVKVPQYVVFSEDGEMNFSGDGAVCAELKEKFEGWSGGAGLGKEGQTAFWGGYADQKEVEEWLKNRLS